MNLLLFNLKTDADDGVLGFTTDWINAFARHYDRVFVITMETGRAAVSENVTVYSVGKEKGHSEPRRLFEFYRLLARVLREHPVDVCFAHMMPLFAVLAWPLLKPRGIPVVLWYAHKSVTPLLRVAHRLVDRVVTANPEGFRIPSAKVRYTGHGISVDKFPLLKRSGSGVFTVISVGRISAVKNVDAILRGFAEALERSGPGSMRLILVGGPSTPADEAYRSDLDAFVEAHAMAGAVTFTGSIPHDQVAPWLAQADLGISLSVTRSFDKAILETFAAGIPTVVYNEAFVPVFQEAGVDPAPYILAKMDPSFIAEALLYWKSPGNREERGEELAKIARSVREKHGLPNLVHKITAEMRAVKARRELI
jgi:glycosyltransferase involved in cell wall biosynthesis